MPQGELGLRRPPKQERSRERVDEILATAKRLIGEKGIDAVKMREIATVLGGPISSIYQYFPNKSAIIAMLHARWSDEVYEMLKAGLRDVDSIETLFAAADAILENYHQQIKADPAMIDVLSAVQADKALNNVDIEATRRHAYLFCEAGRPWIDDEKFDLFSRVAFLMFQLAGGAVRLALAVDSIEARSILDDYKMIIYVQLVGFARPN